MLDVAGARFVSRIAVPQESYDIAHCQQPQAYHRRADRPIDHLIEPAGLEAGGKMDVVRIGNDALRLQTGERPAFAGNCPWPRFLTVAHQQHGVRVIQIRAWIRAVPAVGQQLDPARFARLEAHQQPA